MQRGKSPANASPASLCGKRNRRNCDVRSRPAPREQQLLDLIKKAGHKPGDVVNPADFAEQMDCKKSTCYITASKIRNKGLWPYRRTLDNARAIARDLADRAAGHFGGSQIEFPEHARRRSERSREACCHRHDLDYGYLHPVYTGDPDYSEDEIEYMRAVEDFKNKTNRKFLTTCEYLAIACSLGYRKPRSSKLADYAS